MIRIRYSDGHVRISRTVGELCYLDTVNLYAKKNQKFWGISGQQILTKIGILFFIILFLNFFQNQIKNSFYILSYPVSNLFLRSGNNVYSSLNNILGAKIIKEKNDSLRKENQNLLSQISILQDTIKSNSDFKNAIVNTKENNFKITLVKIIGFNPSDDFIFIDKGTNDGILESMPLISKEKVIYGKVFKVYNNFSQILLISAKNNTFNVKIQPNDLQKRTVYGVLRGNGNLSVYLDLVDFESEIKDGGVLVTSGLEGFFPKDLLVGKIKSVNKSDLKPFQTAEVLPFFNLKDVENLFVITNYLR